VGLNARDTAEIETPAACATCFAVGLVIADIENFSLFR
jgi:hypothetical protein